MYIQTVFKAGNSNVISIPKALLEEMEIKTGQKVMLEKSPHDQSFILRKVQKSPKKEKVSDKEFKKWLDNVLKSDKEILHELELR